MPRLPKKASAPARRAARAAAVCSQTVPGSAGEAAVLHAPGEARRHVDLPRREQDERVRGLLVEPGGKQPFEIAADAGRTLLERARVDGEAHASMLYSAAPLR